MAATTNTRELPQRGFRSDLRIADSPTQLKLKPEPLLGRRMNFLASLSSAVISAGSAALAGGNGVPGLAAYTLGDRVSSYQGKSIWTLYDGIKKVTHTLQAGLTRSDRS